MSEVKIINTAQHIVGQDLDSYLLKRGEQINLTRIDPVFFKLVGIINALQA